MKQRQKTTILIFGPFFLVILILFFYFWDNLKNTEDKKGIKDVREGNYNSQEEANRESEFNENENTEGDREEDKNESESKESVDNKKEGGEMENERDINKEENKQDNLKEGSTPPLKDLPQIAQIDHLVPFTPQAPLGEWSDPRQQDGCEEASALMAMAWVRGESLTLSQAKDKIIKIADYQQTKYGEHRDVSLNDILERIFKDYFSYNKVSLKNITGKEGIIEELAKEKVVLVPLNGQKLGNPYFSPPGPLRHMLVIRGYDKTTDEFITNDPGTRRGEGYRYKTAVIMEAITVYPTGYKEPIVDFSKKILAVEK